MSGHRGFGLRPQLSLCYAMLRTQCSEIGGWSVIKRRTTGSLPRWCLGNSLWRPLWRYRC